MAGGSHAGRGNLAGVFVLQPSIRPMTLRGVPEAGSLRPRPKNCGFWHILLSKALGVVYKSCRINSERFVNYTRPRCALNERAL